MTAPVRCLCCGVAYLASGDCPNVERLPHSVELAREVARWLEANDVENPTRLQIETVLALIERMTPRSRWERFTAERRRRRRERYERIAWRRARVE